MKQKCQACRRKQLVKAAYFDGKYYKAICGNCLGSSIDDISGNAASYERRRSYEDYAQDTIQPYDANGQPRVEFARLYPDAAKKTFGLQTFNELRSKI